MRLLTFFLFITLSFANYSYSQNNWQLGLHTMPAYIQESQQISPATSYVFEKLEPQFTVGMGVRASHQIGAYFYLHPGIYYYRQKVEDDCFWRSSDGGFDLTSCRDCDYAYSEKQDYGEAQLAISFQWPRKAKIKPYALAGASAVLLIGGDRTFHNKVTGEMSTSDFSNELQVWFVPQLSLGVRSDITNRWGWYIEPTYRFYVGNRNSSTWSLGLGINYSIL